MAGACCGLLDQTGGHGIGEMDRCRRVDGLRDEVVRFDHPLLSLFETELLILPFRFRSCLFRRDAPDDVDEVELDGMRRQRRLGKREGERHSLTPAFVHRDADDVSHEVSFDSTRSSAGGPTLSTIWQTDEGEQRSLRVRGRCGRRSRKSAGNAEICSVFRVIPNLQSADAGPSQNVTGCHRLALALASSSSFFRRLRLARLTENAMSASTLIFAVVHTQSGIGMSKDK